MKKALVMGLLALGAVATSYGQGSVVFDNYFAAPYEPVTYGAGNGANTGKTVDDANVHLNLLYTLGSSTTASSDLGLSIPINPTITDSLGNNGYISGVIAVIPGYVSGPVTFQVEAWQTAGTLGGATYALSNDRGISAAWQESSLSTGGTPAATFAGLPGPSGSPLVAIVAAPEPSILALSGIGAAALALIRRKK